MFEKFDMKEEQITISDLVYVIFGIAAISFFIYLFIRDARIPQEVKDNREFAKDKAKAVADVKLYCLRTKTSECQVCIKKGSKKCDVYIKLKGKEIEEFVNS